MVFLHEHESAVALVSASASILTVAVKLSRVRAQMGTLIVLASPMPGELERAMASEARRLNMKMPRIAYLDVPHAVCCTVLAGPTILLSRGFLEALTPEECRLVARHELLHVRHKDPLRGLLWHLGLAALILPGFGDFEHWLYRKREARTNHEASLTDPVAYGRLLDRFQAALHDPTEALRLSRNSSSPHAPRFEPVRIFAAPTGAVTLLVTLPLAHESFTRHLPFLLTHHC